ncbi:hypothetical protein BRC71_05420 [Halobacteriales archaeon QH_7_65_31]|nr:MAG: hypothetical protein BRC71_05420 [Halobacteriales archaeon QH_7_65_31]
MNSWILAVQITIAVTLVLLSVLVVVWGRNYRRVRSRQTLGMLVFAGILLVENGFALYVYSLDPVLSVWFGEQVPNEPWLAMSLFHVLEALAVGFLTYVTLE